MVHSRLCKKVNSDIICKLHSSKHSKHESTSGPQHFIQSLDMKEPARFLKKPLSLLITGVLCRQGGNLWDFMHSHFWWSSSPLSLSVVLKWQHHYCLFEHSGDMASFPLAWWNGSYKKELAAAAMIALAFSVGLGVVISDGFPFMHTCVLIWENTTHRNLNSSDREVAYKHYSNTHDFRERQTTKDKQVSLTPSEFVFSSMCYFVIFEITTLMHDLLIAAGGDSALTDCSYVNVI